MVAMQQFPMFRLATLLARQLSSPFASRIKVYAKRHPRFRAVACMGLARAYTAAEHRFRVTVLRLSGATGRLPRVAPLSDAEATEIGGNLLGEVMIFIMGALIVVFEVNRQAQKAELRALDEKSRWLAIRLSLEELQRELEMQQADLDRLAAALAALREPTGKPEPSGGATDNHEPRRR